MSLHLLWRCTISYFKRQRNPHEFSSKTNDSVSCPRKQRCGALSLVVFEQMPKDPKSVSVVVLRSRQLFISLSSWKVHSERNQVDSDLSLDVELRIKKVMQTIQQHINDEPWFADESFRTLVRFQDIHSFTCSIFSCLFALKDSHTMRNKILQSDEIKIELFILNAKHQETKHRLWPGQCRP